MIWLKKVTMKRPLIILLVISLLSASCSVIHWDEEFGDEGFGDVVGTWNYSPFSSVALQMKPPPLSDDCETKITITFNKNLTGTLDKVCKNEFETDIFKYNIKRDILTITFDQPSSDNSYSFSGINTYIVSGNELFITNGAGRIMVLTKE